MGRMEKERQSHGERDGLERDRGRGREGSRERVREIDREREREERFFPHGLIILIYSKEISSHSVS